MASGYKHHLATATIASSTAGGPTNSSAVSLTEGIRSEYEVHDVTIFGATAQDGTITIQADATSTGAWRDVAQKGSTSPLSVPQNGAQRVDALAAPRIRLQSSTSESANRDFEIWTQ